MRLILVLSDPYAAHRAPLQGRQHRVLVVGEDRGATVLVPESWIRDVDDEEDQGVLSEVINVSQSRPRRDSRIHPA